MDEKSESFQLDIHFSYPLQKHKTYPAVASHSRIIFRIQSSQIIQILPKTENMSSLPFTYHANAQTEFKPPLIANENAFLGDVAVSTDEAAPLSAGFYRLEKGTPLIYEYTYHEMKIIVDGEFDISDETGQKVHATKGDVFYFPKGSKITFTTETFGLGFFVGQRKTGTA